MKNKIKPRGYWTKERCAEEALKYNKRSDFQKYSKSAYNVSYRHDWYNEICTHMTNPFVWTKEKCREEAFKYTSRSEFNKKSGSAYNKARISGWIDEICSHLQFKHVPNGYWTRERCAKEALKYDTRTEFQNNCGSAYNVARKDKYLDEICTHMQIIGDRGKRCIYAAEFDDHSVYIGLTFNFNKRISDHMRDKRSQVLKTSLLINEQPQFKQLTDYLETHIAQQEEKYFIETYRNNDWNILNIANAGAIGGGGKYWNKELCHIEAEKFQTKKEFKLNARGAYVAAYRYGWINDICKHMIKMLHTYSKEECKYDALKYRTRKELFKKSCAIYTYAIRKGWLDEICQHMPKRAKNGTATD